MYFLTNYVTENGIMAWDDFYPLNVVYTFLETLEVQYPSTCTVINIGKSVEGRDIKVKGDLLYSTNITNANICEFVRYSFTLERGSGFKMEIAEP